LLAGLHGGGFSASERDTEDGVGTKTALVRSAVEFNHLLVDGALLFYIHAAELIVEDVVDIVDGLKDALAHVYGLIVVAKLAGFVDTGGGSGGDGGATHGALIGVYFDFDCGVAARVENLTAPDCYNL
jgi:hypothetical protein